MAGTTWPALVAGQKARASDVESRFDWLEGSLIPMNSGTSTDAAHDLGTTTARWNNVYAVQFRAATGSAGSPSYSFVNDQDTGIYNPAANTMAFAVGGTVGMTIGFGSGGSSACVFFGSGIASTNTAVISFLSATSTGFGYGGNTIYVILSGTAKFLFNQTDFSPVSAGNVDLGNSAFYWNDVSYKTLTDRGCLGWFDLGVELHRGTMASDLTALCTLKMHPTKKTVYGKPMIDYKSFPPVCYKKAVMPTKDPETGEMVVRECPRDENDNPYFIDAKGQRRPAQDGVEMTSVFSIMIGALKEISTRLKSIEQKAGI